MPSSGENAQPIQILAGKDLSSLDALRNLPEEARARCRSGFRQIDMLNERLKGGEETDGTKICRANAIEDFSGALSLPHRRGSENSVVWQKLTNLLTLLRYKQYGCALTMDELLGFAEERIDLQLKGYKGSSLDEADIMLGYAEQRYLTEDLTEEQKEKMGKLQEKLSKGTTSHIGS